PSERRRLEKRPSSRLLRVPAQDLKESLRSHPILGRVDILHGVRWDPNRHGRTTGKQRSVVDEGLPCAPIELASIVIRVLQVLRPRESMLWEQQAKGVVLAEEHGSQYGSRKRRDGDGERPP